MNSSSSDDLKTMYLTSSDTGTHSVEEDGCSMLSLCKKGVAVYNI